MAKVKAKKRLFINRLIEAGETFDYEGKIDPDAMEIVKESGDDTPSKRGRPRKIESADGDAASTD